MGAPFFFISTVSSWLCALAERAIAIPASAVKNVFLIMILLISK
jgi:hypothetical protein